MPATRIEDIISFQRECEDCMISRPEERVRKRYYEAWKLCSHILAHRYSVTLWSACELSYGWYREMWGNMASEEYNATLHIHNTFYELHTNAENGVAA